jgi:hypothetical protein
VGGSEAAAIALFGGICGEKSVGRTIAMQNWDVEMAPTTSRQDNGENRKSEKEKKKKKKKKKKRL